MNVQPAQVDEGEGAADWDVRPIAGRIGVELVGVDLRDPLDEERAERLRSLLAEHGVVVFGEQRMEPRHHLALAEALGTPKLPPEYLPSMAAEGFPQISVLSTENGFARQADRWHADVTWMSNPPRYSILHMRTVPPAGGDTMWSSQFAAYDHLTEPMKKLLAGLDAVHRHPPQPERNATHPVVCKHPRTDRPALFVNSVFTSCIAGLSESESAALLGFLFDHSVRPEFVCRWRWHVGDVAIWDNHFVQHYAVNDYDGARMIHRIEIDGEPPIPYR